MIRKRFAFVLVMTSGAVALSALGASSAPAGEAAAPHQAIAVSEELALRIEQAKEELALSDEQAVQVREILKENAKKMQAVFQRHGVDRQHPPRGFRQKRALVRDLRPIRKEGDERLSRILDNEQIKVLDEIRSEVRKELKERRE